MTIFLIYLIDTEIMVISYYTKYQQFIKGIIVKTLQDFP